MARKTNNEALAFTMELSSHKGWRSFHGRSGRKCGISLRPHTAWAFALFSFFYRTVKSPKRFANEFVRAAD